MSNNELNELLAAITIKLLADGQTHREIALLINEIRMEILARH